MMNVTGWVICILCVIGSVFTWQLNTYQRDEIQRTRDEQYNDYTIPMQKRIEDMQRQATQGDEYVAKKEAEFAGLDAAKLRASIAEKELALQAAREKLTALKGDIANVTPMWRDIQNMQRDPAVRNAASSATATEDAPAEDAPAED